ncbi:MAG: D-alanine--D-alanine ligase [Phycisphaeraceae bacterium]|nr:D-alanine--D-alanine ligase [Phycisphaeraceae bacterium]
MAKSPLKILVLRGGPDREREVSLNSGGQVAQALRDAGHTVYERDITPDDLSALEDGKQLGVQVVFPVLHGPWGEGGPLQAVLEECGFAYVGCQEAAARLCMDKWETKQALQESRLPTAEAELINPGDKRSIPVPCVVKALDEGSSYGLAVCQNEEDADAAVTKLFEEHERLMVEAFVAGMELTVGVIEDVPVDGEPIEGPTTLPPIHIVPAVEFYDYDAKYTRDDTQYKFDIEMDPACIRAVADTAKQAFETLGCRHLARIDFIVDDQFNAYILEANTMPGFTGTSLVPKAAKQMGLTFPDLCDHLARLALR